MDSVIKIKRVSSDRERAQAFAIRLRVFVKEQGVPQDIELDRDDSRAIHFLAFVSARAVGTARLVRRGHGAKIGRMAVLKSFRGKGVGRKLLKRASLAAKKMDANKIYLHAQVPVIGFYEKLGFRCVGPVFDEAAMPHRKMVYAKEGGRRI
jgi:predicted GNAT family N-acyltransferase